MKYFITGSTGFLGKNLVKELKRCKKNKLYLYKRGEDISVVRKFKPDYIFHLAAELKDETKMWKSNVSLTFALLWGTKDFNYKSFIYTGTSSEYGIKSKSMEENNSCFPTTLYACTKLTSTKFIGSPFWMWKNIIILRPFSVYGTGEPRGRLMPEAIHACLENKPFHIWEGNHDWIHVDDVVRALIHFSKQHLPGEIINVGTGIQTNNELIIMWIQALCRNWSWHKKLISHLNEHKRKGDSPKWVADTTKAERLGFKAKIELYEGLKRQVKEIVKKLDLKDKLKDIEEYEKREDEFIRKGKKH